MAIQSDNKPDIFTIEKWAGLNQQARRASIDDQELWWDENFFPIGAGDLRSCWGLGPVIYTAPAGVTILRMFFGFIGFPTPQFAVPPPGAFGWMFLSNGHIDQVDLDTHAVTTISGTGGAVIWEPIAPQYWASAVVWRPRFFGSVTGQNGGVLFGSPQGLYAWDGQTLTSPGEPAPDWLTDIAENDPTAPIPPMPQGLPGIYAMEVYQERLFVAGKDVISFSAPSNGADFSTTDGGGSFGYFGDKLTATYMDLAASAGYLYVFGDSSTDLVSQIQLAGQGTTSDPFVTNFNYQNIDPQAGQRFPRRVGRIGRDFVLFNGAGIYRTTGAVNRPIGAKITRLWQSLDTSLYLPTMAPATVFGYRVLLVNGRFKDPFGVTRNLLLMLHRGETDQLQWSVASQGVELSHIGAYEQDSVIRPYGTDGTNLYQLFAQPDPALLKRLSTKALSGQGMAQITIKNWRRIFAELHDNAGSGVDITGNLLTKGGGIPGGAQDIAFELTAGQNHDIVPYPTNAMGIQGAIDLQSISPDFTIERLHILSEERTLFGA
jgi:hypothetical protein